MICVKEYSVQDWFSNLLSVILQRSSLAAGFVHSPAFAGDLTVTANEVTGDQGQVEFVLFPGKESWLKEDHPGIQKRRINATEAVDGAVSVTFEGLDPGDYGLGDLSRREFKRGAGAGVHVAPERRLGLFKQYSRPRFGPPNYDKATVLVTEEGAVQTSVKLDYP